MTGTGTGKSNESTMMTSSTRSIEWNQAHDQRPNHDQHHQQPAMLTYPNSFPGMNDVRSSGSSHRRSSAAIPIAPSSTFSSSSSSRSFLQQQQQLSYDERAVEADYQDRSMIMFSRIVQHRQSREHQKQQQLLHTTEGKYKLGSDVQQHPHQLQGHHQAEAPTLLYHYPTKGEDHWATPHPSSFLYGSRPSLSLLNQHDGMMMPSASNSGQRLIPIGGVDLALAVPVHPYNHHSPPTPLQSSEDERMMYHQEYPHQYQDQGTSFASEGVITEDDGIFDLEL